MRWYNLYGPVARRIKGTCSLRAPTGEFSGPFELIQTGDGALYMQLETTGNVPAAFRLIQLPISDSEVEITGQTSDGQPFGAKPFGVTDVSGGVFAAVQRLTLRISLREAIWGTRTEQPSRSKYGLVNVRFTGNRQKFTPRALRLFMQFDLPGEQTVVLRPVPRYKETEQMLRIQQNSALTCFATTSAPAKTMDQLCHMLSLVQGTIVNWVSREDYSGNRRIRTHLTNRVTRPYSNFHMLNTQEPHVIPRFVNETWDQFATAFEDYRLNSIIRLSAFARQGKNTDLEARGIVLGTILDLLAGTHATKTQTHLRMNKLAFKSGTKVWKPLVEDALRRSYGNRKDISEMLSIISASLPRTTLGERLLVLGKELDIPSIRSDALRAVKLRNSLIHSASFPRPEEAIDDLFWLLGFVDRLLLRLVGYRGDHVTYGNAGPVKEAV